MLGSPKMKTVLSVLHLSFLHVALVSALTGVVLACAVIRPVPVMPMVCLSVAALLTIVLLATQFFQQFSGTGQVKPAYAHVCEGLSLILSLASLLIQPQVDGAVRVCCIVSFLAYVVTALVLFMHPDHSVAGQNQAQDRGGNARYPAPSKTQIDIPAYFECAKEDPVCDGTSYMEPPKYSAPACDGNAHMEPPKYYVCPQAAVPLDASIECAQAQDIASGCSPPPRYTEMALECAETQGIRTGPSPPPHYTEMAI